MYLSVVLDSVKGEFIQVYFKIFTFLLFWDKNLGSHSS